MQFNSIPFLLFIIPVFIAYYFFFSKKTTTRNLFLIVVSYFFYGYLDWKFVFILLFSSLLAYETGVLLKEKNSIEKLEIRRWIITVNIVINLLVLGFFKYYNFFVENFIYVFETIGITLNINTLKIILPAGLSFYTFQALSYSIDIYKKKLEPASCLEVFAYLSFFPQLIAGPIGRSTMLIPQFQRATVFDYSLAVDGLRQFLWGMLKKVIVADNLATFVDTIWNNHQSANGSLLLMVAIFYSIQIYADFSGYSDMAIGIGKLLGIRLIKNFNCPYFSRNVAEFWNRWHISLLTWFRDYIYIPLGGNRVSKIKVICNTFIIFMISGLWHGANWTFIIWGFYHAFLFLPGLLSKNRTKYKNTVAEGKSIPNLKEFSQMIITFGLITIGWVIFRCNTIIDAWSYISCIVSPTIFQFPNYKELGIFNSNFFIDLLFIIAIICIEWHARKKEHPFQFSQCRGPIFKFFVYTLSALLLVFFQGTNELFIYANF